MQGLGALRDGALPMQQQRVAGDRRSGRQRVQHGGAVCGVHVDAVEHWSEVGEKSEGVAV